MLKDRKEGWQRDSWQVCERYTVVRAVDVRRKGRSLMHAKESGTNLTVHESH